MCTCFEPEQRPTAADIVTLLFEREEEFPNYAVEVSEVSQISQSASNTHANVHNPGTGTTANSMTVVKNSIVVNVDDEDDR